MSERLQGHRTKLNVNKMTCDERCSSRRKQPVFSSFLRTVQSSGVAWTWAATLTSWRDEIWQTVPHSRRSHGKRTVADSGQPFYSLKTKNVCIVWYCTVFLPQTVVLSIVLCCIRPNYVNHCLKLDGMVVASIVFDILKASPSVSRQVSGQFI